MNVTVEELYEQAKRVIRGTLTEEQIDPRGFVLACSLCGLVAPRKAEQGMLLQHTELAHPESLAPDKDGVTNLQLDLVWIGEGPPPEAQT